MVSNHPGTLIGYLPAGNCKNGHQLLGAVYVQIGGATLVSASCGLPANTPVTVDFCGRA